ncbi:MAG: SEC-C metal-binding domain-containing protein [Chloroflexota bacterium]
MRTGIGRRSGPALDDLVDTAARRAPTTLVVSRLSRPNLSCCGEAIRSIMCVSLMCGSGRKFKRCHGDQPLPTKSTIDGTVQRMMS